MPEYIMHYFPVRAMGEPIELMLKHAGADHKIHRIPQDTWMAEKAKYPRGTIPVLEVNGKFLCEVAVILKYLGNRLNLCPKDVWEDAKGMEIANGYSDLYVSIRTFFGTPTGDLRKQFIKEKQEQYAKPFLASLEGYLGNASGWVFDELSFADFALHNLAHLVEWVWGIPMADYPKVAAHSAKLEDLPNLRAYFKEHKGEDLTPFRAFQDVDGKQSDAFRAKFAPKK